MSKGKISILGGGSPFNPTLLSEIVKRGETFRDWRVSLMDPDLEKAEVVAETGKELARRRELPLDFSATTSPEESLEGADFVLIAYRIGGPEATEVDHAIPTEYGIVGDETTGPGGTFMAQYTIPPTLNYCESVRDICPEAWIISYANPASHIADAVRREYGDLNFISICDTFAGFSMEFLPQILDMPPYHRNYNVSDDIKPRAIGVNHFTWLVDLLLEGEDGYPELRRRIKDADPKGEKHFPERDLEFQKTLIDTYGYAAIAPSHCRMYWMHDRALEIRKRREDIRGGRVEEAELAFSHFHDVINGAELATNHEMDSRFLREPHGKHVVGVMKSIVADEGREWGGLIFPNRGTIENLPAGAIVEGPCLVDAGGPKPIKVGEMPESLLGFTQGIINWEELSVTAALTGRKDVLYQAILASPYVRDMGPARKVTEELLTAHSEYLPQYN